ncbi:MAG: alpha/beta fold hydrolase [Sulfurimonadaceae bacterium]
MKALTLLLLLSTWLLAFKALPEHLPHYKLTTEQELTQIYESMINRHFDQGIDGYFSGEHNISIHYMLFPIKDEKGAIVVSNGRTESIIKYKEFIYDLNQNGYSVYLIDHRGQGFSGRMAKDRQMGHVDEFNNYVLDLYRFVKTKVKPRKPKYLYLLGHSMGGAIAARYLEVFDGGFNAAILNSPMFQPNLYTPNTSGLLCKLIAFDSDITAYAPGEKAYDAKKIVFDDNLLTHSKSRFEIVNQEMQKYPKAKIGGPSVGWIQNACKGSAAAVKNASKITMPLLILRGSEDKIVNPKAVNDFCSMMGDDCHGYEIEGAWHELLIEKDLYRSEAISAILTFLDLVREEK